MPHSYGASFSGVGFFGPSRRGTRTFTIPKPAPSPIMIRIGTQPCMAFPSPADLASTAAIVNVFSSAAGRRPANGKRQGAHNATRSDTGRAPQTSNATTRKPGSRGEACGSGHYNEAMRLAWFSPLLPVRTGVSVDSRELVTRLGDAVDIDVFVEDATADDARQIGRASCRERAVITVGRVARV